MAQYDIAIIGTGPAGLEAAITATVRNKRIVLFGSKDLSMKLQTVDHPILNYLGLPSATGKEMAAAFSKQLEELQISIDERKVTAVYAMGDFFALQLDDADMVEAESVILATGVVAGKPYAGEEKLLGRGVSYCATCDGPLYKGKTVAVVAQSAKEEAEAEYLAGVCEKVYYFPLYQGDVNLPDSVEVIHEVPVGIEGEKKTERLVTRNGSYDVSCVFILREAQFPGQLVAGLQTEGSRVVVDLDMKTNIPGLFAAGDLTGQPYQYIKSAGQGNVAALSAVSYVDEKRRSAR